MAGLVKNEFLTMRKVILLYAAVLVVYYLMGVFFSARMSGVQVFAVFFAGMLVISSFSYEEKSGWNVYVNVLPVSCAQIVMSKYVFSLICTTAAGAFGMIIQCAMNVVKQEPIFNEVWVACMAVIVASLFLAVVLPVLFKAGAEKSRVILMMIFLIPFTAAIIIEKMGIKIDFSMERMMEFLPFFGLGAAAVMLVSCAISIEIYKRKEF